MKLNVTAFLKGITACFILIAFLFTASATAEEIIIVQDVDNDFTITQNNDDGFIAENLLGKLNTIQVKTEEGIFTQVLIPAYSKSMLIGAPELPVKRMLIEIPLGSHPEVEILAEEYTEYRLEDLGILTSIFPRQPEVPKSGEYVAFEYDEAAYLRNQFYPQNKVSVESLGILRGVGMGRLNISPVRYNPTSGKIRVYTKLEVRISFPGADLAATLQSKRTHSNHYFTPVYKQLANYRHAPAVTRDTITAYPISYLIISDPMFTDVLAPLVEWKTKKGFNVIEAYTDDPLVGNTKPQIKAYIQDLYDNATPEDPAPSFVLFVGDIDQVPTWTGNAAGHVTDLFYCEFTNDYFPEIYYGRMSAETVAELQPQIDKTLMYEQYTMPDPSYLNEVVMVAGVDGTFASTHGNGQINYGTINYFNETFNIISHTYLYPESGSSGAAIRQDISNGVTYANYTAHCSGNGWGDPSFNKGHIPALQNLDKYGLLVGNCCSSSEYQQSDCFGEEIVMADGKGAVGYIGASNSTMWDPDYYWGVGVGQISGDPPPYEETTLGVYDGAFHSHGEPFDDWYTTQDQMIFAGNLAVTEGTPGSAEYYWEAYCLMGDPSLMIYFSEPPALTVTYDPLIPMGAGTFNISTEPYAYAAISMNGELVGAALADEFGEAVINVSAITMPGSADVVVTAQNRQPFEGTVMVDNPEGPFIMLNTYVLDDSQGNGNGLADYGETILFDVELKNWGSSDANGVTATLETDNLFVVIDDNTQDYGLIVSQDSVMQMAAFQVIVEDSIPDQEPVAFNLQIEDDGREVWSSEFTVILLAPELHVGQLTIDDIEEGNGNGRLDAGETVDILIKVMNEGSCPGFEALATLASTSEYLTLNSTSASIDTLPGGSHADVIFNVTVAEGVEVGTAIDMAFDVSMGPYAADQLFMPVVGLIVEDFETGDFTAFDWYFEGQQQWQIVDDELHEGIYASKSGDISDEQSSELMIDLDVLADDSIRFFRKVSCEDDPYNDDYDYLAFIIDGTEMGRWDGEVPWGEVVYPITAGEHTLVWKYYKDYSVSAGSDCAWVDYILFPGISDFVSLHEISTTAINANVYPNPAKDRITIELGLQEESVVSFRFYDYSGREIQSLSTEVSWKQGMNEKSFNTTKLPAGAYYTVITTGHEDIIQKFMIIK